LKGSTVGFSFLTLFSVIVAVLAHMGIFIGVLLGDFTDVNLTYFSTISIFVAILNASIVFGLRRRQNWAVVLGSAEMLVLVIAAITNLMLEGFSELLVSCYWLLVAALFLFALKGDYEEFRNRTESHV
jgi:peptidoglycan/LPS O-acetylase OafA/YrhL